MKILHIYQNTPNGELLFYTLSDFLAFFTLVCTTARRFGIRIIGICAGGVAPKHLVTNTLTNPSTPKSG